MATAKEEEKPYDAGELEKAILDSSFVAQAASSPLRICCYGSSAAKTPTKFLNEAWNLGFILAKRGHTCVNGAGSFGCMAAMNDGADAGDGHIVGVIHEMFIVDGNDWYCNRDGGAHRLFKGKTDTNNSNSTADTRTGPTREMLVAGGKDLQERKRLLVEGAEGLIVLPGGPGTWDELWEMACARNLGLISLPIVCVSVDGYYDNFRAMLDRAFEDCLIRNRPEDVVHFVSTSEEAVRWIEMQDDLKKAKGNEATALPSVKTRASVLRKTSFLSTPAVFTRSMSWFSADDGDGDAVSWSFPALGTIVFVLGVTVGILSAPHINRK
ncbi:riboside 5'-monophosphate phosphoribohydrolase [Seminavis robusta]|uniref:Riboside 5'-monophosphate phosphoribohydrolase n=1 Tax=Seminavis robusta TaxID=568900 RepID=A0A9N8GZC9_9STRA|nr:riboside 5'-monophosphate phosphoribohydrolase [Seminavis robusta]|eukprot:Sro2_g001690.1 riboside 5'-monophosphate phosphoribohydrolase (325) ;mRNA; f:227358-228606